MPDTESDCRGVIQEAQRVIAQVLAEDYPQEQGMGSSEPQIHRPKDPTLDDGMMKKILYLEKEHQENWPKGLKSEYDQLNQ